RSNSGTETVDGAVRLLQDLKRRTGSVDRRVGGILELLRNENPRVFFCHTKRSVQALLDTGADIAGVMAQDHLRAVMADQFPPFLADGVRHDDLRLIPPYRAYQRKADPLIAACGFHDDRIFMDQALFLRVPDHIVSGPCLDGSAYIKAFEFHQNLGAAFFRHTFQTDQRRMSHRLKNIIINHYRSHTFLFLVKILSYILFRDKLSQPSSFHFDSIFPSCFAIRPTSSAAATVPSLTPCSLPVKTKERTQAIATSVTSNPTFIYPNFTGRTLQIASTTPSPARTTTPAFTSRLTPTATKKMPIRHTSHCCR